MKIIIEDTGVLSCKVGFFTDINGKYHRKPISYRNLLKEDKNKVRQIVGNTMYNIL